MRISGRSPAAAEGGHTWCSAPARRAPPQGRTCGLTVAETIAAARGSTPAEVGHLRLRTPVRPATPAQIASLPRTEADQRAVERL